MIKNIAITGAGGYVGSVLIPLLLRKKYKVVAIDRFYFGLDFINKFRNKNLKILKKDIRSVRKEDFKNIDVVIDLAGLSNDPTCDLDVNLTKDINYLGRIKCAKIAKEAGVKKYLFSSSASVYGNTFNKTLSEISQTNPISEYAKASLKVEKELLNKLSDKKFTVTIIRNGTIYGYSPRMRFDLVVNLMTLTAFEEGKIYVNGGGEQFRPLIHILDVCNFFSKLIAKNYKNEIFNLGIRNIKIIDLATIVKNCFKNKDINIITTLDDPDKRNYNIRFDKIKKIARFQPKFSIEYGAKEVIKKLEKGEIKKSEKTSTLNWYKYLIESKKTLDEILIDNRLF